MATPPFAFILVNRGETPSGPIAAEVDPGQGYRITGGSCMEAALPPGERCTILVQFQPSGQAGGARLATLRVQATSGGSLAASLSGVALTPAHLGLSPQAGDLGSLPIGTASAETTFTLVNDGQTPTGPLAVTVSDPVTFAITSDRFLESLAPGGRADIRIRLVPVSVGSKTASLLVTGEPGIAAVSSLQGAGTATLTILAPGTGTGVVTSDPAGIRCGSTCSAAFSVDTVLLVATPGPSSQFSSWSGGGCSGTGPCRVTMDAARTVTATFTARPPLLTLSPDGGHDFGQIAIGTASTPATYTVKNSGLGSTGPVAVGLSDEATYAVGGSCAGQALAAGGTCSLTVSAVPGRAGRKDATLTVSADPGESRILQLSATGSAEVIMTIAGTGRVVSSAPGLSCDDTCSVVMTASPVTLTAIADPSHRFAGWSGACSGTGACVLDPGVPSTSVKATFTAPWALWPMPDSPTVFCTDGVQAAPCPGPGGIAYGQDGNYGARIATYTTSADTVTDPVTGLEWQRNVSVATVPWQGAMASCADLVLAGSSDWRLPSKIELVTLVDYGRSGPAIDPTAFPGTPGASFWTSSPGTSPGYAAEIDFDDGAVESRGTSMMLNVRCVR